MLDQGVGTKSRTGLVEQINRCLRSGDYSRALDLVRGAAAEAPNDAELSALEKLAQDGVTRKAEADLLITESQELFAQRKSAGAIQLLRKAYDLDKKNSLARSILANALVEHAQSLVETDWLQAETLSNQALALNPAHPTAKTVLSRIVEQKEKSSVEDWASQARKLQSSGDLFAALAWVAEGLAVHPHDAKLLQIQDEIQRDQEARRRQARRGDLEDLRRLQREIDGAKEVAAKQALAERIQAVAAKYWTDGEILSIANALLLRLGLVSQENASGSPRGKNTTLILHVPRPSSAKPSPADRSQVASDVPPSTVRSEDTPNATVVASQVGPGKAEASLIPPIQALASKELSGKVAAGLVSTGIASPDTRAAATAPAKVAQPAKVPTTAPEPQPKSPPPPAIAVPVAEPVAAAAKVPDPSSPSSSPAHAPQPARLNLTSLVLVAASAAIVAVAATLFFTRKHYAPPTVEHSAATTPVMTPTTSEPPSSTPAVSSPTVSQPLESTPSAVPEQAASPQSIPEPPSIALPASSNNAGEKVRPDNQTAAQSAHDVGTLLVVAGQDNAKVFLNGKLQRQLTQAGQLRIPNLDLKDYVVQVAKSGFQDPPQQQVQIHKGEQARLVFTLQPQTQPQPQPRLASLTIRGGVPGTAVFVDQAAVGTVQADGSLSLSTVNPGDHSVELRKDRFKPRQLKEHFVAGGTISLAAAEAALEALPGELKIIFTPADAKVAIVKGDFLAMVSSGVPLNLAPGAYTLTVRTADRFTRSSTLEVAAGQSRTLDLSLAPNGMSKWDNPGAWKQEKDTYIRKGGDFVLYDVVPASGTFIFSAMPVKGHVLQWVLNYTDPKNYVLFQMDDNSFSRAVIRNGEKTDEIRIPDKSDKKTFRTLHIRVSPTELVHEIKDGNSWTVVDRWTQPGANLGLGKFGFYIPGSDEVALSSFTHYADLTIR